LGITMVSILVREEVMKSERHPTADQHQPHRLVETTVSRGD
jgi:hypothetical protein